MVTARQTKMAELMAEGASAADAYIQAGYKGDPLKNASDITGNRGFQEYFESLRDAARAEAVATRTEILEVLTSQLRGQAGETPSERRGAAALIAKLEGYYAATSDESARSGDALSLLVDTIRKGSL